MIETPVSSQETLQHPASKTITLLDFCVSYLNFP